MEEEVANQFQELVRERFNALVSSGTSPNNAALEALNEVRKILSERTQSASTETKPSRESTPQLISEHQPELLNPRSVSSETIADIIDEATASNSFVSLIRAVGWVFSDYDTLAGSFLPNPENHTHLDGGPPVPTAYQGVFPRSSNTANFNCPCIDFSGLDVSFALLLELKEGGEDAVDNAMWSAIDRLGSDLLGQAAVCSSPRELRVFLLLMLHPGLLEPSHHSQLHSLLQALLKLGQQARRILIQWLVGLPLTKLAQLVNVLQQFITVQLYSAGTSEVMRAIKVLQMLFTANQVRADPLPLALFYNDGVNEEVNLVKDYRTWLSRLSSRTAKEPPGPPPPPPATISAAAPADLCSVPTTDTAAAPADGTTNAAPCAAASTSSCDGESKPVAVPAAVAASRAGSASAADLAAWAAWEVELQNDVGLPGKNGQWTFIESFCVLNPAAKAQVLLADARLQMRRHFERSIMQSIQALQPPDPYLVLRVRRDQVVMDTLQQVSCLSSSDLKKPLKVKFMGEDGVDEGGVRKEFFQVMIRQLLDPAFAMFLYDEDTRFFWFNSHSLEAAVQFELIGILLGLAIYNGVLLEVHYPKVVYSKLLGYVPTLEDLKEMQPLVYRSLHEMLRLDDVTDLDLTFSVTSKSPWGDATTVDLVPDGHDINVNNDNKLDFVRLYVHHLLVESVSRQFGSFFKGFHSVCGGFPMKLFHPSELELLLCGSEVLDIHAWEAAAAYEPPYQSQHRVIRDFWSVVHTDLTPEEQKKLLAFCTGSDRAPINGLGDLQLVVSRQGPDSPQLPTSHTCFNHLLLPEYVSREKLKRLLLLAITQSEGFGLM